MAVGAAVAVLLVYRRGFAFSPDGWTYWQASISLLQGDGYRDLFGLPVVSWPPLYPLVLAGVQAATGVSVFGVTVATALLLAATVVAWHALWRWLAAAQGMTGSSVRLATLWTALILVHHTRGLRSEALLHLLIPCLVWLTLWARDAASRRQFTWRLCWLWMALAVGVATRQSAPLFGVAAAAVLLRAPQVDSLARYLGCGLFLGATVVFQRTLGHWLGLASHPLGIGLGEYSPLEYLDQLFRGLGRNLGEATVGLLMLGFLAWRSRASIVGRYLLLFSGVALVTVYVLFNCIPITDQLRGRMTLFAVLLVAGNGLLLVPAQLGVRARWLLLLILFGMPAASVGKYLWRGRGPAVIDLTDQAALRSFLPSHAIIDKGHVGKSPLRIGSKVVVSPPMFPWIEARLKNR